MPFSVQLQDRSALYLLTFLELALCVALVLTWWASTPSALRLAIELLHVRPRLDKTLRKSKRLEGIMALLFSLCLLHGRKNFVALSMACQHRWMLSILSVAWTMIANLMKLRRIRSRKLPLDYSVTNFLSRILLDLSPYEPLRIADILLHMKLVSRASRPGLTVGVLRILCNGLCTAQRCHTEEHDLTCRVGCPNEPDSLIITSALVCIICLHPFGDRLLCFHGETIFSMI